MRNPGVGYLLTISSMAYRKVAFVKNLNEVMKPYAYNGSPVLARMIFVVNCIQVFCNDGKPRLIELI